MFPWSAVFSLEPKVPGQRSTEELVTNTLMLELGAMVKRTERIRLERATEGRRRRRSSSTTADYSWLASTPTPQPYELTPNDLLELQDLCAKIPPAQCGPLIVRWERQQEDGETCGETDPAETHCHITVTKNETEAEWCRDIRATALTLEKGERERQAG